MSKFKSTFPPKTRYDIEDHKSRDLYHWMIPLTRDSTEGRVVIPDRGQMVLLNSYSYLSLIGHPRINAAAIAEIAHNGTGTDGVRLLAGTLPTHIELEQAIARFKKTDAAVVFSNGYVTNVSTISALMRPGDVVICDKLNHASIFDGCMISQAKMVRFNHNDLDHLESRLRAAKSNRVRLVVADAVFSMDGDVLDVPKVVTLCRKYDAYLMIDEAHSLGVLGENWARDRGTL
jgi:7-keto-8-aminopelargonate synthetase-like enzyme